MPSLPNSVPQREQVGLLRFSKSIFKVASVRMALIELPFRSLLITLACTLTQLVFECFS
jgi:hypothetical protein